MDNASRPSSSGKNSSKSSAASRRSHYTRTVGRARSRASRFSYSASRQTYYSQSSSQQRFSERTDTMVSGMAKKIGDFLVSAWSIAGLESTIVVKKPQLNLCFDIGAPNRQSVDSEYVFVTHGHLDHVGGLPQHASKRNLRRLSNATYFMPPSIVDGMKGVCDAYSNVSGYDFLKEIKLHGIGIAESYQLKNNRVMKPFKTFHRVDSQGYLIYKRDRVLKPEFRHLSLDELPNINNEMFEYKLVPEIAYTGDTTFDCFLHPENEDVLNARLLITEVTYLDPGMSVQKARDRGHIHLQEISENAYLFNRVGALLLVHPSDRYTHGNCFSWLNRALPPDLRRKTTISTEAKNTFSGNKVWTPNEEVFMEESVSESNSGAVNRIETRNL